MFKNDPEILTAVRDGYTATYANPFVATSSMFEAVEAGHAMRLHNLPTPIKARVGRGDTTRILTGAAEYVVRHFYERANGHSCSIELVSAC